MKSPLSSIDPQSFSISYTSVSFGCSKQRSLSDGQWGSNSMLCVADDFSGTNEVFLSTGRGFRLKPAWYYPSRLIQNEMDCGLAEID